MPRILRTRVIALLLTTACASFSSRFSAPAAASLPQKISATESSALVWGPGPGPHVKVAVAWGDPKNGHAGGEFYRFENGFTSPQHTHPFTERAVVIAGTFIIRTPEEPELRLGHGSFFVIPAETPLSTACQTAGGCEVYNEVVPR